MNKNTNVFLEINTKNRNREKIRKINPSKNIKKSRGLNVFYLFNLRKNFSIYLLIYI